MENKSLDCSLNWDSPPREVVASEHEVHVWRVALNESRVPEMRSTLSPDECARADRFHFERDRNHFIIARGSLRIILSGYLKKNPTELSFSYSNYGKPALFGEPASSELSFNLSHAHELALIAVTRNLAIGVDIEFIRSEFAAEEIAERFFSRPEVRELRGLPANMQSEAFFTALALEFGKLI
ncbi:MAG: phosphopantetheine-protein transferase, partial [Pyrinomonadaceae bacterium]